ncbi:adenosylcobinamide-GDP ribazoletransferase [Plantactinospora sp. KBS50]|uniref:adenosylcobinamide-GDP ribazoletransferase n=1 Tax=Plantactinospora sp. KBS50 TaxID=2024580 RepID=UPI0018E015E3|nr:adenosylcobinamide-GDP ribazoletransferase [Plantactinospora sp. KBS50]
MADRPLRSGARLALTTFTVLPLPPGPVDRRVAGVAMLLAPAVGALLGAGAAAVLIGSAAAGAPPLVAGALTVAAGAALTRGLHLDGLADTADGLGSYRTGPAALEIMRRPDIGPFGVVALVLVLLIQAGALAALADRPAPAVLAGVVTAVATGRLAAAWGCRRGVPAARPDGLGALVAGTVGGVPLALAALGVAAVALAAVPHRPWQGPLAVLVALVCAAGLLRHLVRRLGGVTGDVLGALLEVASTVVYLGLVLTA